MAIIVVEVEGVNVAFMTVHLDHRSDVDREFQIAQMLEHTKKYDNYPIIFGGDLNAKPDSPELKTLFDNYVTADPPYKFTFPNKSPDRTIDYLFIGKKSGFTIKDYSVIENINSSDHLPLTMTLSYSF